MNLKRNLLALVAVGVMAALIGCAGSGTSIASTGGGSTGGPVGGGVLDMTFTASGSNNDYSSMHASAGTETSQVTFSDTNIDGTGILTVIAIVPDGTSGKTQTLTFSYLHDAALATGAVIPFGDSAGVDYTELKTDLSAPYASHYKIWLATAGSLKILNRDGNHLKVELQDVATDPNTADSDAVGHLFIAGTAEGDLTTGA